MNHQRLDAPGAIARRQEHSRGLARGLALACALAMAMILAGTAAAENVVSRVAGEVEIGRGEPIEWTIAQVGDAVHANDRVRTGPDGRVEIEMDSGTMRVHENSMLRLPPADRDGQRVELEQGHSLFDVIRRSERHFEVHTPTVVVSVKGTRFGVDTRHDIGEVAVYHGVVGVREAGIEDAIETLVREGFLATGGSGLPIELDVTPEGDPWASWSDLRSDVREGPTESQSRRLGALERAKAGLHRATDADVVRNAAERRPEVAERLRRLTRGDSDEEGRDRRTRKPIDVDLPPLPAAPLLDGDPDRDPSLRNLIDGESGAEASIRNVLDAQNSIALLTNSGLLDPSALTNGDPFASGETRLLHENLVDLTTEDVLVVIDSLEDLTTSLVNSATTVTSAEFATDLEAALLSNGMDQTTTTTVLGKLLGN